MRLFLFFVFTLTYCFVLAQQKDKMTILILKNSDTLIGKLYTKRITPDTLRFQPYDRSKETDVPLKEVDHYLIKNRKYVFISEKRKHGDTTYFSGRILHDGITQLLAHQNGNVTRYFVQINQQFYSVSRRHFSSYVWNKLSECSSFLEEYKNYYAAHHNRWILMNKHISMWIKMLQFYDQHCY